MADAKKCDRCGQYYVRNTQHPSNNKKTIHLAGMRYVDENGYGGADIDLCDDCITKLKEFLKGEKENADN